MAAKPVGYPGVKAIIPKYAPEIMLFKKTIHVSCNLRWNK